VKAERIRGEREGDFTDNFIASYLSTPFPKNQNSMHELLPTFPTFFPKKRSKKP
jgi:hypothetical protein